MSAPKDTCWNCNGEGGKQYEAPAGTYSWFDSTHWVTCVVCLGSGMSYPKPTIEEIADENERRWSQSDDDDHYYEEESA